MDGGQTMKRAKGSSVESWQPPAHVGPDGFKNSVLFALRLLFDFEVLTTYWDVRKFLKAARQNVLEVGCGSRPYRHLVPPGVRYTAIDGEQAQARFHYKSNDVRYYNGDIFPLQDRSFDYIFHTEVLEHVYNFRKFLSECRRVLTPDGKMFFTVPFAARYHYIPDDYWRFTPTSLKRILREAGFSDMTVTPRGTDFVVAVSKVNAFFFRLILTRRKTLVLRIFAPIFFCFCFVVPITLFAALGHLAIFFNIGSQDDPLGYSVACGSTKT
jgi:SAM-dependent methyltransferase